MTREFLSPTPQEVVVAAERKERTHPNIDLRRGQREGLDAVWKFFDQGQRIGYIHHPTAYGKTRLMAEIANNYGGRHIWITPGIELVDQTKKFILAQNPYTDVGTVGGGEADFGHQTTVITPDSLDAISRRANRGNVGAVRTLRLLTSADLIFVDEVHHFLTTRRRDLLGLFPNSAIIGATATDKYSDRKNVERRFGPKIHEVTLQEAIEEGALTHVRAYIVRTGQSLDEVKTKATIDGQDFNVRQLEKSLDLESRDELGLNAYKKLRGTIDGARKRRPAIAFCISRDHARKFAREAQEAGVPSAFMTGDMNSEEREQIWKRFENGEIQILAAVNLLNESMDKPWIEVGIMLRPTKSRVLSTQRLGRLLRPSPETGKQFAYVIEVFDDMTDSATHSPVTVFDIFNVRKFRNGEVISRSAENADIESEEYVFDSIPIEQEFQILRANSPILEKIEIIRDKLVNDEESGSIRSELETILTGGEFSADDVINFSAGILSGMNVWSGDRQISIATLVKRFTDKKGIQSVSSADYTSFLNFVFGEAKVSEKRNASKYFRVGPNSRTPLWVVPKESDLSEKDERDTLGEDCKHHWVIGETGSKGIAPADCKACGEHRTYSTRYIAPFETYTERERGAEEDSLIKGIRRQAQSVSLNED